MHRHSLLSLSLGGLSFLCNANVVRAAGVGSSGGGFAVVCRSTDGTIESAQLLDLYEGQARGDRYRQPTGNLSQDYAIYLQYIRIAGDDTRPVAEADLDEFQASLDRY